MTPRKHFRPLTRLLIQQVLLYTCLFWLLVSAIRAGMDYQQGRAELDRIPQKVSALYLPLVAQSVWDVDLPVIQRQLVTIGSLPGVVRVTLDTTTGQRLGYARPDASTRGIKTYAINISVPEHKESLGTLKLQVSSSPVQTLVLKNFLFGLGERIVEFTGLALLIVFLLRKRLVDPIREMADGMQDFHPGRTMSPLRLSRHVRQPDELDQLLESINALRNNINRHLAERIRYELELTHSRDQLAERVAERTAELEATRQALEDANRHLSLMALSDPMTGLANRRHFDNEKHPLFRQAQTRDRPLSLLLIDIDHFKEYNDHYGHPAGDACLKKLALTLQEQFDYPGELVARIGGEEFAVFLTGLGRDAARTRAEALRQAVWTMAEPHVGAPETGRLTISIGVAGYLPSRHTDVEALISDADLALYQAKHEGRNRVVLSEAEPLPDR